MYQPCENYLESLSLYVDELLTGEEKALLEAHLKACMGCRSTLQQWRQMAAIIAGIPDEMPPADLRDRIFANTIRRRNWLDTLRSRLRPAWLLAPPAAALALGVWFSTIVFRAPMQPLTHVVQEQPQPPAFTPSHTNEPVLTPAPVRPVASSFPKREFRATHPQTALRLPNESPRLLTQPRMSRLNETPAERRSSQPEVAVHDIVNDTPVNTTTLTSEPGAPIENTSPTTRATLASDMDDMELDGMIMREAMQQQIRTQLKRDNDSWRQLRTRNMKERRLNVPVVTIKF